MAVLQFQNKQLSPQADKKVVNSMPCSGSSSRLREPINEDDASIRIQASVFLITAYFGKNQQRGA
jgi:hypothetical protein